MLEVFIPYNTLETAILDETELLDILSNLDAPQRGIQVYDMPEDWIDEENPVYVYSQELGVDFNDCADYIQSVISDNEKVLEHPCGFFILEESSDKTAQIQSDYGVICQPVSQVDTSVLKYKVSKNVYKGKNNRTWQDIFGTTMPNYPCNSIVIIDRYVFAQSKHKMQGVLNLYNMLNVLLPQELKTDFHVSIVIELTPATGDNPKPYDQIGDTIDLLSQALELIKNNLKRSYNIVFEILAGNGADEKFRDNFHNRRIISNYYYVKNDHGFCSFDHDTNAAFYNDSFQVHYLFSEGLNNDNDVPDEHHSFLVSETSDYYKNCSPYRKFQFKYARNGEEYPCMMPPINRLLSQ